MSIKRALRLIEKFAAIVSRCKQCGAFDEYLDPDNPYCYKCFDPNRPGTKKDKLEPSSYKKPTGKFNASSAISGLKRIDHNRFSPIDVGKYKVSIQGSSDHYCAPRKTLDNPNDYTYMEVAIFKDDEWVVPLDDPKFKDKSWAQNFEQGGSTSVGSLPRKEIEKMLEDLYNA